MRRSAKVISGVLAILLAVFPVSAEDDIVFKHISRERSGLSHDAVRCLLQDSRGYVWIGTQMGLNRYDGIRVKNYYGNGLASNFISCMCEDKLGNIWIGTSQGISCYSYEDDVIKEYPFENVRRINSIVCDSKGVVWFDAGLKKLFTIKDGIIRQHSSELPLCDKRLALDSNDRLVIFCAYKGIFTLKGDSLRQLDKELNLDLKNDEFNNPVISRFSNDIVYFASKRYGLCEMDLRSREVMALYDWDRDQKPTNLCLDSANNLYVSTSSGLIKYDIQRRKASVYRNNPGNDYSLSGDYVFCAMVDAAGDVWVGTREYGLNFSFHSNSGFRNVNKTSAGALLNGCMVRGLSEDSSGMIWVATERMGLLKYNPENNQVSKAFENSIPSFVTTVISDGTILWVGSQNGIFKVDLGNGKIKQYLSESDSNLGNRVLSFCRTSQNILFAGCTSGMLRYDSVEDAFVPAKSLDNISVEASVEDMDGILWLGTYSNGVISYDPAAGQIIESYIAQTGSMISSVMRDNLGRIWSIGIDAEFALYDKASDSFIKYNRKTLPAIPDASFISAQQDMTGNIWFSTTSGIVRFSETSGEIQRYSRMDGILNDYFGRPSISTSDGVLVFGSLDGLTLLNPDNIKWDKRPERVDIAALYVGDNEIRPSDKHSPIRKNINIVDEIRLRPGQNYISLEFSVPGGGISSGIECCLQGVDRTPKVISPSARLVYDDLKPGNYILSITAHKNIRLIVEPPFLLSKTGILLLTVLIIMALVLIYSLIEHFRRIARNREKERQRLEQESILMEEKMNFLANVVHEVKTPLTLIKTPLNNLLNRAGQPEEVTRDLKVIENGTGYLDQLSKELLGFIRAEKATYELNVQPVNLTEILNLILFNVTEAVKDRNLKLILKIADKPVFVCADRQSLNKILNNLLDNSIKYADSYIEIELGCEDNEGKVWIKNDGFKIPLSKRSEIFKPFVKLDNGRESFHQSFGIGLPFAKKLAELQHGSLDLTESDETEFVLSLALSSFVPDLPSSESEATVVSDSNLPSILVIEDNTDLCTYLKDSLSGKYCVFSANSAEQGLSMLMDCPVDMIVSDLSMPGMGGTEMCRRLSKNFDTSHIPIIIISAIADEESKIKCIENGASYFIEKPFTIDYLKTCIAGTFEKLERLRRSVQDLSSPMDLSRFNIKDRDAEFISQLSIIVDKHIDDYSFTVKQLEQELCISHTALNRKMAGLLKTSPLEYIRTRRIVTAARILKEGQVNVSEVSYLVGFNTPSYFIKCFKRYFGKTPQEYMSDEQK